MRYFLSLLLCMTFLSLSSASNANADASRPIVLSYAEQPTVLSANALKYGPPYASLKLAGVALPYDKNAETFMRSMFKQTKTYPVEIHMLENAHSRYSTPYATVNTHDLNYTLQQELLMQGLVRFFPYGVENNPELAKTLQKAEQYARDNKNGLWAEPNSILAADKPDAIKKDNKLALVTGKIVETVHKDKNVYVNFGDDWKKDFTIVIPKETWEEFPADMKAFLETPSVNILVRGFMGSYNGPTITVKHPAQIEILP